MFFPFHLYVNKDKKINKSTDGRKKTFARRSKSLPTGLKVLLTWETSSNNDISQKYS